MASSLLSQVKSAGASKIASKGATVRVVSDKSSGRREYSEMDHFVIVALQFQLQTLGAAMLGTTASSERMVVQLLARGLNRSVNSIAYKVNEKRPTKVGKGKCDFRGAIQVMYHLYEVKGIGTLANGKKSLEEVQAYFEKNLTPAFFQAYTDCYNRIIDVVQAGDVETAGKKNEVRAELPEDVRNELMMADKVNAEAIEEMMTELFSAENIASFHANLEDIVIQTEEVETQVQTVALPEVTDEE